MTQIQDGESCWSLVGRAAKGDHETRSRFARVYQTLVRSFLKARWQLDVDAVHRAYAKAREEFHSCLRQVVARHVTTAADGLDAECQRLLALLE